LFQEDIMAWDFGPVIKSLYEKLIVYGNGGVHNYIDDYAGKDFFHSKTNFVIEKVWSSFLIDYINNYADPSYSLSTLIKSDNAPWHKKFITERKRYEIITEQEIINYYSKWIKFTNVKAT